MSPNLLGMAKDLLGDSVMDQLGGMLGANADETKAAVGAGLPTILGGLLGKANEPGGSDDLFNELDNHDGGILDSLGDMLSGDKQSTLLKVGGAILAMVLGSKQGNVVGSLARMLGMGNSKIGGLLSVLAPLVMGMLSKQRAATPGFGAADLQSLLSDQKQHIAADLPSDLRSSLGVADLFDDGSPASAAPASSQQPAVEAKSGGIGRFLPWIILVGLALLAWNYFSGSQDVAETPRTELTTPQVEMPDAGRMVDLRNQLGGAFDQITGALGSVTDLDSAKAAAQSLTAAGSSIDGLDLDALPAAAKPGLRPMVSGFVDKAKAALEAAYQIPGVQQVLQPIADPLLSKLGAL